jgi:excisionase family DNA binding protein
MTTGEWMTLSEVARRLELSSERVRQLTVAGRLPCVDTPLGRLYARGDVEAFMRAREAAASEVNV